MIQLSAPTLTKKTLTHLRRQQAKIDALSSYAAKVDQGKALWGIKDSTRDAKAAFKELKDKLRSLTRPSHRAVWESMKRQRERIPRLNQLFALAPAALDV